MFNFLKKKELNKITELEEEIEKLKKKTVIVCRNRDCVDFENETCSLNEVVITFGPRCEDYESKEKSVMKELQEETQPKPLPKFVIMEK